MSDMATAIRSEFGLPLRRISVDDYHRMGGAGILLPEERVELLDGVLITMPPSGERHAYSVRALSNLFWRLLGERAIVSVQLPLRLNAVSEPDPDIALLEPLADRYDGRHPVPLDALLVIEVADTSRAYDRGPKLRAYQNAGVREVWIVDPVKDLVEMWRRPEGSGSGVTTVARRSDRIAAAAFPDALIAVEDILPRRK
jgi:Uma2 family endonuclease